MRTPRLLAARGLCAPVADGRLSPRGGINPVARAARRSRPLAGVWRGQQPGAHDRGARPQARRWPSAGHAFRVPREGGAPGCRRATTGLAAKTARGPCLSAGTSRPVPVSHWAAPGAWPTSGTPPRAGRPPFGVAPPARPALQLLRSGRRAAGAVPSPLTRARQSVREAVHGRPSFGKHPRRLSRRRTVSPPGESC